MGENNNTLERLSKGDEKLIDSLYASVYPSIKVYIQSNNGREDDAADIFQRALLQICARYLKTKQVSMDNLEGYVYVTCRNLWLRELKKNKTVSIDKHEAYLQQEDTSDDEAMAAVETDRMQLFKDCLDKMKGNCKEVLNLFFARYSHREIAEEMSFSNSDVARQKVFKCKKKLVKIIQENPRFTRLKVQF